MFRSFVSCGPSPVSVGSTWCCWVFSIYRILVCPKQWRWSLTSFAAVAGGSARFGGRLSGGPWVACWSWVTSCSSSVLTGAPWRSWLSARCSRGLASYALLITIQKTRLTIWKIKLTKLLFVLDNVGHLFHKTTVRLFYLAVSLCGNKKQLFWGMIRKDKFFKSKTYLQWVAWSSVYTQDA